MTKPLKFCTTAAMVAKTVPELLSLTNRLQICIILVGKRLVGCLAHLLLVLLHKLGVDLNLGRSKGEISNKLL